LLSRILSYILSWVDPTGERDDEVSMTLVPVRSVVGSVGAPVTFRYSLDLNGVGMITCK
jgi:hypothetical protein